MKKILLFVAMALQVVMANAFEGKVEIDGINYYILTKAAYAEVVSKDSGYEGDVVIPETVEYDGVVCTVKKIDNFAFSSDSKLTSISIPKTVTVLGNYAFSNCKGLKKVIIDNLESWCTINIGDYANPLQYAEHLIVGGKEIIDLVIPETITSIADRAFHGYKGLKSITIGDFVTYIGDYAFYGCTELKTAKISGANVDIGRYAFYECTSLAELMLLEGVSKIGNYCFYGCTSLSSLTLSEGIIEIGEYCFQACNEITHLSIPNSVDYIDAHAFDTCKKLKTIKIGNGVKKIGNLAFARCAELTDVFCWAENPPTVVGITGVHFSPFYKSYPEYATLHVPEASISAYEKGNIWKYFGKIVALTSDETDIEYVKNNSNVSECVRYTLGGQVLKSAQKGINIIRMSDGTTKKVLNK
ncbi:MAG: leucine-rich repeat domain-containing protein [Bacteroidaceae bacterium]|nr:leucine-rich repeat domain-containing protein [Bacteroidaceae bacterium]